jgi:TonB family protein
MFGFLIYDLKVAVLVAVFYMFYRLLLSRDTLHRLNRVVLLATALASFVLPLCVVTIHHTVAIPQPTGNISAELPMMAVVEPSQPWWQQAAVALFLVGVAVTLAHLLWSVSQVVRIIRHSEQHQQTDGTIVCVTDKDVSPFSWMRYIVLNHKDYESPDPAIMAHERGHIRQRHSADVLLVDTLTVLQWFNPSMWMLRQDLRAIHEYEADLAVLSQGINMRQYQYLLIQKAVVACGYSVANGITHSTLKNRINMMLNNKKSTRRSMFKLLALLPIVGIALALNAETVTDYVYEQPQKKAVKKGRKAGQIKVGAKTIEVRTDEGTLTGENVIMGVGETDTIKARIIYLDKADSQGDPLVIIDGKKSTKEQLVALDSKAIDHVDVLKNKAAVEVYGEEGKNGVIIITTIVGNASKRSNELVGNASKRSSELVGNASKRSDGGEFMFLGNAKVDSTGVQFKDADVVEPGFSDVFDVVEQMPEFPGGPEALMQFLRENICYPEAAFKAGAQGRVLVSFIVDTEGRINNAKVIKKVNDDLDAEAIRVIGSMPNWKPGRQNGKAVRVRYTVPITFRLD